MAGEAGDKGVVEWREGASATGDGRRCRRRRRRRGWASGRGECEQRWGTGAYA